MWYMDIVQSSDTFGRVGKLGLDLMRRTARASADEASAMGIHWTFSPMVDVCRDAAGGVLWREVVKIPT